MFLRLKKKASGEFILFNMDHVIRVEAGDTGKKGKQWCRLMHLPGQTAEDGSVSLSYTDIEKPFEEMAMLLSGKWIKDPL
ncbi:MAG: hypothetical protein HKP40_03905 [Litoreibacter sp.]|nr:hypothetical protein [Litoreibacter sp.]